MLNWPKGDIERLNNAEPVELLYKYPTWKHQYTDANAHPEFEELKSVVRYIRAAHGADNQVWPASGSQEVKREGPASAPGEKDCLALVDPSPAYQFYFYHVSGHPFADHIIGEYSPLLHISFDPFIPLGFAFWSQERILGYGFLRPEYGQRNYPQRNSPNLYFFA
jgi:hypothetical protein